MRQQIEQIIRNSGTRPDSDIVDAYHQFFTQFVSSKQTTKRLDMDSEQFMKLKHQIFLENMGITDQEIDEIASMIVDEKPETRYISLSGNLLTDKGIRTMCQSFLKLKHLVSLDLVSNHIGAKGFEDLFALAAQSKNDLQLSLRGNLLSESGEIETIKINQLKKFGKINPNHPKMILFS